MVKYHFRLTNINPEILNHRACIRRIIRGILNKFGAAEVDEGTPFVIELVTLRVAAEVIVIIDNEDARARSQRFLVVVRCRQATNSTANDHQVVLFAGIDRLSRIVPAFAVPHEVCEFK